MDITRLPEWWRQQAARQSRVSSNDVDIRMTLQQCARELELAWHQHAHDAAFEQGCMFCDWEREHEEAYPEPRRA